MNVLLSTCQWIMTPYATITPKYTTYTESFPSEEKSPILNNSHSAELCRFLHAISFSLTTTESHVTSVRSDEIQLRNKRQTLVLG